MFNHMSPFFIELGAPEVLVYNAGAMKYASALDITPEDFERTWRVRKCQANANFNTKLRYYELY